MRHLQKIFFVAAMVLVFAGCKELDPGINFKEPEKPLLDTTYTVSSVPAAQAHRVLLFDITGVRCVNCPKAARLAHQIDSLNPGRITVVAIHPWSSPSLTRPWPGYDTLQAQDGAGEFISSGFGTPPSLPIGMIDQKDFGSGQLIQTGNWLNNVSTRLNYVSSINIDLKTEWLTADNKGRLEAKVTFTSNATNKHLMFIAVMENGIIGRQSVLNSDTAGYTQLYQWDNGYYLKYINNHILRKVYTSASGDTLKADLSAGRVFEKHYYIVPRKNWNPKNLEAVVWVVDAVTKEVVQVAHKELYP